MASNPIDKEDMLSVIRSMPAQIREGYDIPVHFSLKGSVNKVIFCGMGGSAISGMLMETMLHDTSLTVLNVQDYQLPTSADKNSLIFIVSYSGNTEETISCYREAQRKGLNTIVITSGGKLKEYAETNNIPLLLLPKGIQPRNAIAYMFFPILKVLEHTSILPEQKNDVASLMSYLTKHREEYEKTASKIAEDLHGSIPIVYSSQKLHGIAYRWKCEFNENAKISSFCGTFPELNHNELVSYVNYGKMHFPLHVILLRDESENRRLAKRMDLTKKMIKEATNNSVKFTDITVKGDTVLNRIFTTIYLGDLVSYFLALRYFTDPTPVAIIENFKKQLGPYV
jgi:glucose/mannose-6-phosphate isomerase